MVKQQKTNKALLVNRKSIVGTAETKVLTLIPLSTVWWVAATTICIDYVGTITSIELQNC